MSRANTYASIGIVKSGGMHGRGDISLAEYRLMLTALGIACADSTDEGRRLYKRRLRLLKRLTAIYNGDES